MIWPLLATMKWLGVFLTPLDGTSVQRRVTSNIEFACTHLYTWLEVRTVKVKKTAQCPQAGLKPRRLIWRQGVLSIMPCQLFRVQWEYPKFEQDFPIKLGQPRRMSLNIFYSFSKFPTYLKRSRAMNQFVTMERQISVQMVQLVKVDHLHRWSQIFGSERNKMDLSTWLLTKITSIFVIMESTQAQQLSGPCIFPKDWGLWQ